MSTFRALRDKALDVDPDLRFMALEDLKKVLTPANQIQIEHFVDTLFKLLKDSNANVQSQTIKVFPTLIPYISNTCIINIVSQLFAMIHSNPNEPDQIAAMTLKLILNSNYKFDANLSRSIISSLLHRLLVPQIDSVTFDVLIEVIKTFKRSLEIQEFLDTGKYLVNVSFKQSSSGISKKAVYAFDLLLADNMRDVYNDLFGTIDSYPHSSFNDKYNRLHLILRLITHSKHLNPHMDPVIEEVQTILLSDLTDFDYDQILEDNLIKEVSLDILIELKEPQGQIISKYIDYNPLKADDDDDIDFDADEDVEEIEFSDDDEIQEQEEFDDGSWKLRYKAIKLVSSTTTSDSVEVLPRLIAKLDDKNEIILKSAVEGVCKLLTNEQQFVPEIESKILGNLTNETLMNYLPLLENVIKQLEFQDSFVDSLLRFINQNEKNLEITENLNLLLLIVESTSISSSKVISELVPVLCAKVNQSSTNVSTVLKILDQLSIQLNNPVIFDSLVERLHDTKILIDFKVDLLNSLTTYILHNRLTGEQLAKVFDMFELNLKSESTLKTNLINLNKILDEGNPNFNDFANNSEFMSLIGGLKEFLNESNQSALILSLTNKLGDIVEINKLLQYGKAHKTDYKVVNQVLENLGKRSTQFSSDELSLITDYMNSLEILEDIDLVVFSTVIEQFSDIETFLTLKQQLNPKKVLNIKFLSLVTVHLGLENEITSSVQELNKMIAHKSFNDNFIQLLQYLSFINLDHKLDINISELIELLSLEELNDAVKFEISKNLGYLTNTSSNLLIEKYITCDNELIRINLLNSIKFFIKNFDDQAFEEQIYNILLDQVNVVGIMKEFKLIGEVLSIISIKQENFEEICNLVRLKEQSIGLTFTNLVIINHLILDLNDKQLINSLVIDSIRLFDVVNIDIQTMLVKNLINLYYSHPDVLSANSRSIIIPKLVEKLQPYAEFKKTIPMGPYKYVIDEGLEIRKLVFELLYSIINDDTIDKDLDFLMRSIIEKGLVDKEVDIVNLSYMNLTKLVYKDPEYLNDFNNLAQLIENLTKNQNKKLKSKATNQEIEVYNESKKALVNVSEKINEVLKKYGWKYSNWDSYYEGLKRAVQ